VVQGNVELLAWQQLSDWQHDIHHALWRWHGLQFQRLIEVNATLTLDGFFGKVVCGTTDNFTKNGNDCDDFHFNSFE
jgi:hypothetical protein